MAASLPASLLPFAREVLERHGALVEQQGEGPEVLLPQGPRPPLLASEELLVIEPGAGSAERAAPTPLLTGLVRLAQGEGRLAALTLPSIQRPPQGLQREVAELFPVTGATARVERLQPGHAGYLLFTFLHELRGEKQARGTTQVLLAAETRLEPPGLLQASSAWDLPWEEPAQLPPVAQDTGALYEAAARLALRKAERKLGGLTADRSAWLTELDHQMGRYSEELAEETTTSIARRKLSSEEIERRQQRLEESQAALARLREELRRANTIRLRLTLLGVLRLNLPVLRASYVVQRGKLERTVTPSWSALTQGWEQLACESCGAATFGFGVCPGAAHVLCPSCHEQVQQNGAAACGRCRPPKAPIS